MSECNTKGCHNLAELGHSVCADCWHELELMTPESEQDKESQVVTTERAELIKEIDLKMVELAGDINWNKGKKHVDGPSVDSIELRMHISGLESEHDFLDKIKTVLALNSFDANKVEGVVISEYWAKELAEYFHGDDSFDSEVREHLQSALLKSKE